MKRGEVVIVEFPYVEGRKWKNRPALVVQNDNDNRRLSNTIVAMISGNVTHADEPTQLLVDPTTPEGHLSGLHGPSVVKCCNLFTIAQSDVKQIIGRLSNSMMPNLEACLKAALELK
jgi:mRNA interferase MazF